jgi:hypothetical protein
MVYFLFLTSIAELRTGPSTKEDEEKKVRERKKLIILNSRLTGE